MKAYELLEKKENWTKGWFHRNKAESPLCKTEVNDPLSCSHCLLGALKVCYPNDDTYTDKKLLIRQKTDQELTAWNDDPKRTHEEVYNLLKQLDI